MVRALEAVADRHLARGQVDQGCRNEEGTDAPRALVLERQGGVRDPLQAANAGADHDAGAFALGLVVGCPAGILDRLLGGRHAVEDEVVDLAAVLRLHVVVGVEVAVGGRPLGHLARHLGGQVRDVEGLHGADAGLSFDQMVPHGLPADPQGGHESDTGYDNSSHVQLRTVLA